MLCIKASFRHWQGGSNGQCIKQDGLAITWCQYYALVPLTHFTALYSFRDKPELWKTVSLLARMKSSTNKQWVSQTIVTQPSYYLGTFQTVFETQHSGILFLQQNCYDIYIYRFHRGVKQPGEISEVPPLPVPASWRFRGCNWGRNQIGEKNSQCWVGVAFQARVSLPSPVLPTPAAARIGDI